MSFFTLKLLAEAKKIEIFPTFQRWMKKIRWPVRDMAFRDQFFCLKFFLCFETRNFEFTKSKFRVYKLEISSLQTQNFDLTNSKFRVDKLEISSSQSRNFEFTNSKFRVNKLEILSLQTRNFEFVNSKF